MKNYKVTVNGNTYEVGVEEVGGAAQVTSVAQVAPAPKAEPVAAPVVKPAAAAKAAAPAASGDGEKILAPLPGVVLEVKVKVGDAVKANQELVIFEAMKMENEIVATRAGTVKEVFVAKGDTLDSGMPVISLA